MVPTKEMIIDRAHARALVVGKMNFESFYVGFNGTFKRNRLSWTWSGVRQVWKWSEAEEIWKNYHRLILYLKTFFTKELWLSARLFTYIYWNYIGNIIYSKFKIMMEQSLCSNFVAVHRLEWKLILVLFHRSLSTTHLLLIYMSDKFGTNKICMKMITGKMETWYVWKW